MLDSGVRYISYNATDYYIEHQVNSGDISPLKEYKKDGYQLTYQTLEAYAPEEIAQNVANAEHEVRVNFTQQNLNTEIDRLQNLIVMFLIKLVTTKVS